MKLIKTIKNIWSIEELRTRILNTIGFIIIFRLGSYILLPGLNYDAVVEMNAQAAQEGGAGILDMLNNFLGGAFNNKAIFALGIMPYISASIVVQLLQVAVPQFQRLQKEGESGRKKMNQITRYLTIIICVVQSFGFIGGTITNAETSLLIPGINEGLFTATSIIVLTAGTMFCMWLGEKITEKGIGNGISMLIMVGIISRLPFAAVAELENKEYLKGGLVIVLELVALFFVVMLVVMITQATRRITVNYAKQVIGNKVYGGQRQYIPLKVNAAGVMPIIFAQSVMFLPPIIAGLMTSEGESGAAGWFVTAFGDRYSFVYGLSFAILIILFTYFYTAITINPNQIADDLKRNGGFIPGIKPGAATAEFIDNVLSKITLPGAIFIAIIAILPAIANNAGITSAFADFYGGTSLLIMVGVVLDTLQQIESYLLMRKYEGMMKSGKIKGRTQQDIAVA